MSDEDDGWASSAQAWIATQGPDGDFARRHVLDEAMLSRVRGRGHRNALDVGCGEGRFARLLRGEGIPTVGIDPTVAFIERAKKLDPSGDYRVERAETMTVTPASFDLVVSYLALVDIEHLDAAVAKMAGALRVGGSLLVANLNSYYTAGQPDYWRRYNGQIRFAIDAYSHERAFWASWKGIRIRNWHRPLSRYMKAFLGAGLSLRHFDEPLPTGGAPDRIAQFRRVPWFYVMEWVRER